MTQQRAFVQIPLADLAKIIGGLPRCPVARGRNGDLKAIIPSRYVGDLLAEMYGQKLYSCGGHWHLTTSGPAPRPPAASADGSTLLGSPVRPRNHAVAVGRARDAAARHRQRTWVYGVRNHKGQWRYVVQFAAFRDQVGRDL